MAPFSLAPFSLLFFGCFHHTFDSANNRTGLAAPLGGTADFANTYQYDPLQPLTDLVHQGHTGGNAVAAKHITFAYNEFGQTIAMTRYQSAGTTTSWPLALPPTTTPTDSRASCTRRDRQPRN
jgi:uncharacterized protein RhaS with RHS repeats